MAMHSEFLSELTRAPVRANKFNFNIDSTSSTLISAKFNFLKDVLLYILQDDSWTEGGLMELT